MAVRKLDKFINTITQKLFPALRESIGLNLYSDPVYSSPTVNTYAGELGPDRVRMEISSNHIELADYANMNTIFATIYYKGRGSKIGVLNLDDINECVGLVYATLYELGYRTPSDLEKEQKEKEEKAKAEEEKKKAEIERQREIRKAKQQAEEEKEQKEPENIISPKEESEQSINEVNKNFDKYLSKLIEINSMESKMIANIIVNSENTSYKVINIEMIYISKSKCYIETNGINPKIEKTVTWNNAKNYIIKVAEAVTGVISLDILGPNGEDIDTEDSDSVKLNIDI